MTAGKLPGSPLPGPPGARAHPAPEQDPFEASWRQEFWYHEKLREKWLILLLHLAPYSAALLLTGEAGSGKTTLLHQFLARVNDTWRICQIQGAPDIDHAEILDTLDKELSLHAEAQADEEERIRHLRDSLYTLRRGSLVPIAVIDDSHLLSQAALLMLSKLTEPRDDGEILLGVILVGDPSIEERLALPGLGSLRERISHTIALSPLGEEATAEYIRHRMRVAGHEADGPFTPAVMKFIHVASGGLPGRINELARGVLRNETQLPANSAVLAPRGLLRRTLLRYGFTALALSVAIVALFYQDTMKQYMLTGPAPDTVVVIDPPTEPRLPAIDEDSVIAPAEADAEVGPEVVVPAIEVAAEPAVKAPPPEAADTPEPSSEPAPGPVSGPRDDAWLLAQSPEHYTLQLFASTEERARAFIAQHALEDETALYRSTVGERPLYAVVFGVFPTRQAAGQAGQQPPVATIRGVEPWIRTLRDVQQAIGEAGAQSNDR